MTESEQRPPPEFATARGPGVILTRAGRGRRTATLIAGLLALAAGLLLTAQAQAGLKFAPPQTLSQGDTPQVAIDSEDRATVVWLGSGAQSVRLGADGSPGEINTLGQADGFRIPGPQVAVDPQGRATVVWELDTELSSDSGCSAPVNSTCVQALRLEPDASPGTLRTLSRFDTPDRDPIEGNPGDGAQMAVDPDGRATVVWQRTDYTAGTTATRIESVRIGADGVPGAVKTLSGDSAYDPKVAVDPQGRATVVWQRYHGRHPRIESVRLSADGTAGAVKTLSKRGQNADEQQVAVDPRGRATVVWRHFARGKRRILSVRIGSGGKSSGAVKVLSTRAVRPQVAVDPRGRATVVWLRGSGRVQALRVSASGAPRAVKNISKGQGSLPQVAVDRQGRATVVWERQRHRDRRGVVRIEARHLRIRGASERVQTLSKGDVASPQVAVDSKGRPTVVWEDLGPTFEASVIRSTRGTLVP
jgi:hypothetical protein